MTQDEELAHTIFKFGQDNGAQAAIETLCGVLLVFAADSAAQSIEFECSAGRVEVAVLD